MLPIAHRLVRVQEIGEDTLSNMLSFINFHLRLCLVAGKRFSENMYFSEMLISGIGKCIEGVWLSWKSFYGKSIPVFDSSKYFTEIVLRKINSGVWFIQIFYGKYFTENVFPCLVRKILYGK